MRVTTGPPRRVVTGVAGAAIVLAVLLLVIATIGGTAPADDVDDVDEAVIPPAHATTQDTGLVNPWAAGDAAALQELAGLGRAHLDGCR